MSIGIPKSMFTLNTEGALFRISPVESASQWLIPAAVQPHILHLCHYLISRTSQRVVNVLHRATTLALAPYGEPYVQYSSWVLVMHTEIPG